MNEVKDIQSAQESAATVYEAPRVEDLGAWEAVTLINSVGINPGGIFNPNGPGGMGGANGY